MEHLSGESHRYRQSRVRAALETATRTNAIRLDLSLCGLTDLPSETLQLAGLQYINLSGNKLRTVPPTLWNLSKLRSIDLTDNPIEVLPNRRGLTIDRATYTRCGSKLDAKNITHVLY